MSPQTQLVLILALGGAVLMTLGYRIRFRREWHLIGVLETRHVRDPEGFGNWVGSIGLVLGSVTFGAAALALTRPDLNAILGSSYAAVVLAATAILSIGSLRYIL